MQKSEKRFELLPGFPHSKEPILCFGGQPAYAEGFIVRFFKANGDSWIGNFRSNRTKLNDVYETSQTDDLLVFAEGTAYLLDSETTEALEVIGDGFYQCLKTPNGTMILSDGCKLTILDTRGEKWESERISWDEIKDLRVAANSVRGLAYDAMDTKKEWKLFSLNLETKVLTGGSYANYIDKHDPRP
ncbi:hypothetical protein KBD61_03765 [Patescibacteria group bacterium]|nr:hypothetical protein [Patescibacteria group bacterium]MBP9710114.1 hypothetical protein [Patescibacteria group bacterium]